MNSELGLKIAKVLSTTKIEAATLNEDGAIVISLPDGQDLVIYDATLIKTERPVQDTGHLVDPFETPTTPACLGKADSEVIGGGNTCHPEAKEMFPGPGT